MGFPTKATPLHPCATGSGSSLGPEGSVLGDMLAEARVVVDSPQVGGRPHPGFPCGCRPGLAPSTPLYRGGVCTMCEPGAKIHVA